MLTPHRLPLQIREQLQAAGPRLAGARALVGFDGFVDSILHVVKVRESATAYTRMTSMVEFAGRIAAAAGLSANLEMVTQMVKLGGNGPIMANALGAYGTPVTYMGNLGYPRVHAVFEELARRATVHSIAEPGYTDAIEFEDGKLMFGKHESLKEVNWANLLAHVPEAELLRVFADSSLIAVVNWTMLTQMDGILHELLTRVAPLLTGDRRWLFFDLADPAKRSREDLRAVLEQIARFRPFFRVVLGLNLQEARQAGEVFGFPSPAEDPAEVTAQAVRLHERLEIDTVVIHPTYFAAAADATGATHVPGPYTLKPLITTGAGDHFNAGFCIGRVLGFDLAGSLQLGVSTSGFYVRHALSPDLAQMCEFLHEVAHE